MHIKLPHFELESINKNKNGFYIPEHCLPAISVPIIRHTDPPTSPLHCHHSVAALIKLVLSE